MDWWIDRPEERYWCEVTDRVDVGGELKCPQTNEQGKPFWSYELIRQIQPGDLVFHYKDQAVIGCSVAGGPLFEKPIEWRAQGTSARSRPGPAESRPGWALPLSSFTPVQLSLDELRRDEDSFRALLDELSEPRKVPWLIQGGQLRGAQAYLAKMPAKLVSQQDVLLQVASQLGVSPPEESLPHGEKFIRRVAVQRALRRRGLLRPPKAIERPDLIQLTVRVYRRSAAVVAYVLERAAGHCEACESAAPFVGDTGEPFLEVHHVRWLAHDGPDRIDNAVALCPNCHRALHLARDRSDRLERLYQRMACLQRFL